MEDGAPAYSAYSRQKSKSNNLTDEITKKRFELASHLLNIASGL